MDAIEKRARELVMAEIPDLAKECFGYQRMTVVNLHVVMRILRAALTPPEGFVLVPIDSVRQCGCGCHRYCCGSCGTELGGHSYEPTRPEVP
ncbi:hypothetical protein [Stenotrophomonas maltophilia]|uniref:hypothetical protein n=1 Tax=Stenotrophomonas maltophilia TaxID=40324 RepID=UPI002E76DB91|nr:hypothetical protein [Stenotrophomonas maltophilia]